MLAFETVMAAKKDEVPAKAAILQILGAYARRDRLRIEISPHGFHRSQGLESFVAWDARYFFARTAEGAAGVCAIFRGSGRMRAKTAVVLGAQWGDEGKGKIVDVLSERFSAVARYAGGHNAGHTVIHGSQKFVLQLIPCGVLRPGCKGVIGNGVVLDPIAFLKEVAKLRGLGIEVDGQTLRFESRPGDPTVSPDDRAGSGKCAGT